MRRNCALPVCSALEKGFYRDAGFEIEIREGGPHVDSAKATAAGEADFGVCTASVLLDRVQGRSLIVLGVIFQHSAATLLTMTICDASGRTVDQSASLTRKQLLYRRTPTRLTPPFALPPAL